MSDQFATTPLDVKQPYLLCAPASEGSPITNPATHLCCYKTKAPKLPLPVHAQVDDSFGSLQVEVKKSTILCQPCTKTLLP